MASKKLKIARNLLSNKEKKAGVSPFNSKNWNQRTVGIFARVKRNQDSAHTRAEKRRTKRVAVI